MENSKGSPKTRKDFKEMVKDIRIAMLCTITSEGYIHSRPMGTSDVDEEGNIWFFTSESSQKINEVEDNSNVSVCYADPDDNTYVCVMGTAQIVHDRKKIDELWNPALKIWFPEGKEDPEIVLIKIDPISAEYWDSSSSKMVVLFNMAKALVTGKEYDEGEYGKINL
ncbi:pyridoxamine 5'-phosphate oxidase family protein [Runella slithyformis]|uniref:Pyridoxamine 5'-phosphate oxidase-related FMN-binding protein n=1 Tax=Runella slithyformis (strain ATCC 29530 / DSM 19594 / LMG 11500 / NCIMB 11436 / LSU 4) TaxID=761193 RepID=A0A7U3ZQN2_RUNSL|nr:pyridoxamine 5'-phosphate oxidase family protein [Runella slithyformis]AEI51592.1 pyridoxamine 5'-phosphate oxidase-related FMN-binding protein [Runella slithyformis DSM 19594]